ncbi:MAG: branched-chain amino acid ABC transporter permease [Candidatus Dormibacteraceae bacterium]
MRLLRAGLVTGEALPEGGSSAVPASGPGHPLLRMRRSAGFAVAAVGLVMAIAFPLVFDNPAMTSIGIFTMIFVCAASAWNMFSGLSGYIALGNTVFFGVGAYAIAIAAQHLHLRADDSVFLLVPVAGLVAGVFALPFGWLALRTRRHTFVVITIAFFFIFQLLAYNLAGLTQGAAGMSLPVPQWDPVSYNAHFYYAALIVAVATVICAWLIHISRFGLELRTIKDDEDRARGLGVLTDRVKMRAFVVSGIFTGFAGGVYAYFVGSIYPPDVFVANFDVTIAIMSFLGGLGTISGPVVGALLLEPLQQYFTLRFSANGIYLIAYGVLFLIIIRFLPAGIVPTVGRGVRAYLRHRAGRRPETLPSAITPRDQSGSLPHSRS